MTAKEQGLPEELRKLAAELRECRTDYDGSILPDGAEPIGVTCGLLCWAEVAVEDYAQSLAALASDTGERGVVIGEMQRYADEMALPNGATSIVDAVGKWSTALRAQPAGGGGVSVLSRMIDQLEERCNTTYAREIAVLKAAIAVGGEPVRTFSAYGYSDADRARIVSSLQSARDRMASVLPKAYGEGWDGDLDTMLEAINYMKRGRQNETADFKETGAIK